MKRRWMSALALAWLGLGLTWVGLAAQPVAADEKYVISSDVWGVYQEYLRKIDNGDKPGAYAITKDGYGAFYVWCEEVRCMAGATYGQDAVNYCEREYDTECVVFAVRDDIRVEYEIAAAEPSVSTATNAPALSDPPPPARIAVSPAVKAKIDSYLGNTRYTGKAWALAIANDGSDVATASCPISAGFAGGRACDLVKGTAQELASREAIVRCGGAAACALLYEGGQIKGNVEIVTQ